MFAVIKTGGKQYRVTADETITVMSLAGEPGEAVTFGEVLMLTGDESPQFGGPFVEGASVTGTIVEHKRGHRQDLTVIKITDILANGAKAAKSPIEPAQAEPRAE